MNLLLLNVILVREVDLLLKLGVLHDGDVDLLQGCHFLPDLYLLAIGFQFGLLFGLVIDLVLKVKVLFSDNVVQLIGVLALHIVLGVHLVEVKTWLHDAGSLRPDVVDIYRL